MLRYIYIVFVLNDTTFSFLLLYSSTRKTMGLPIVLETK